MIAPSYRDFSSFPWTWWWEKSLIQSCTIFPGQSSFHWPNFASLTFFPLFWSYLFPCLLLQVVRGSLKVVFQSRIGPASMFQCFIIFILRFSWQNMLCCYVHGWLRWLVKALRDPFVWLQQRPYERSFLSQGFDLMVAGNVPSNVPKVISRYFRCWDLKIRVRYEFARWGPRNGEFEHLLAVLRYDTG